jgi:1,4-dihydroxy-2-naphthoate octaprenyltransferase
MSIIQKFLDYAEIKTKITSVLPFLMTLAYLLTTGRPVDPLRSAVFFLGMLLFDLTATTINNYSDTKKDSQPLPFSRRTALTITVVLLLLSVFFGIYLVTLTDIAVLALGGLCFLFGILYSYGPLPISHGPYGEVISGFFYGILIPAILVYINDPTGLVSYTLSLQHITLDIQVIPAFGLALLAVVPFCLTANIMLANNICDVARDVEVHRYTLAFYLKHKALYVFAGLYYVAYLSVIALVAFGYLPWLSLLMLVTLIPVQKNINRFFKKQIKEETFIVSIKNFILILLTHAALIAAGSFLPGWGPI